MHPSSYFIIEQFALAYTSVDSNVLEVGSWSAPNQRSAREAFWHCASYVGLDLANGPGVDLVAESPYHPLDCWRYYPDASSALAMYCGCDIVETGTLDDSTQIGGAKQWKDWFVVLRKPQDYALVDQDSIRILNAHRRNESPVPLTKKNGPILDAVRSKKTAGQ